MGLGWMVWTEPTAIFFAVIALILVAMTMWQVWRRARSGGDSCRFRPRPATGCSSACW